jgi:hypothetical protein
VLAPLVSDEDWKAYKYQRDIKVSLACCKSSGFLRTSKLGTKHFVHKSKTGCDWKPETKEHLLAKSEIVKACWEAGYEASTEVSGLDWRADVLATKGKIKIAFEVQWSPQSLQVTQERQAKYKRDGIRGCWFFRKLPTFEVSHNLPMFELSLDSDNKLVAGVVTYTVAYRENSLFEFVKDLLSKQIKFCDFYTFKSIYAELIFFPVICWKCDETHHIYDLQGDFSISSCGKKQSWYALHLFKPEIIAIAKEFLKTDKGKNLNMGEIKPRMVTKKLEARRSFGCPRCDAFTKHSSAYFSRKVIATTSYVIEKEIKREEGHWCYPKDGNFCT